MLSKLDPSRYDQLKGAAHDLIARYPLINAIISKIQAGHVYADIPNDSFFIATKSGFSLFSAGNRLSEFNEAFFDFLKNNRDIPDYIHIYSPEKTFLDHVTARWDKYKIRRRVQFRYYQKEKLHNYETLLPSGYSVASIQNLDFDRLEEAFKLEFSRRYWNSREDFMTNAVGACILNEQNELAAICYSACIIDGIAEMDTLVLAEYRGRKFMRIVSEPFFNMTFAKKLTPHWDTFVSNTASYVLAQKFGLKAEQEYDLLSLLLR